MVSTHPQPFAIAIACVIRVSKVWKTLWGHKCSGFLDRLWSGHFHVDPWSSMIYQFPVGDFLMQTGRPTMRKLRVRCGFTKKTSMEDQHLRIQWFPSKAVGNPPVANPTKSAACSSCREHPGWLKGLKIVQQKHGNMAPFWCVSTWTRK